MTGQSREQLYAVESNDQNSGPQGKVRNKRLINICVFLTLAAILVALVLFLVWFLVPGESSLAQDNTTSSTPNAETSPSTTPSSVSKPGVVTSPEPTSSSASVTTDPVVNGTIRGPAYDYVYRPDSHFSWEVVQEVKQENITSYIINMTSQQWFDGNFTNRPLWWHHVVVHVPDNLVYSGAGSLYISARNNLSPANLNRDHIRRMGVIAAEHGIVTAAIEMVPNQPVVFEGAGNDLYEDDIIAFTWKRFLNLSSAGYNPPSELLLHMPMVKASARAMDTMSELVQSKGLKKIDKYFIAGQSKRGWTAWILGAIDERVVGMAPTVLSCLNMEENFRHYWRSFGGWPFALKSYWDLGLMGQIDEFGVLAPLTDPFAYRKWMTMPKLVVNGASDEFFLLDDFDYFYDDIPGEKHIWILENHGHSLNGPLVEDYWGMLGTFAVSILEGRERPTYQYWRNTTITGGSITVRSSVPPINVSAFSAPGVVPHRRDFRLKQLGPGGVEDTGIIWTESNVEDLGNDTFTISFENPDEGYFAFYIKLTFPAFHGQTYTFTTKAHILPEGFPYEDCVGKDCNGQLV